MFPYTNTFYLAFLPLHLSNITFFILIILTFVGYFMRNTHELDNLRNSEMQILRYL